MLSRRIKTSISNYFNKGGYVLDLSNATFDEFTEDVVGIPIQEWASKERGYGLSKGKSFEYFINTQSDELIYKLVFELVEHLKVLNMLTIIHVKITIWKKQRSF